MPPPPPAEHAIRAPHSLPIAEIAAPFNRADLAVSIADAAGLRDIEALSRAADPHDVYAPVTAGLLSWFTDANPHGPGFVVIARAPESGAVVGHFLFYATTLVHAAAGGETTLPSYLYVNLYVAPSHRRKGVFAAMFAFGIEVLRRMGVPFAYTVPNPRSSPGFAKAGVPLLGTLPCWMAPAWAPWRSLAAVMSPGRATADVARVPRFDAAMIPAADGLAQVRGLRTEESLNWRFGRRPGVEYAVWRVGGPAQARGYVVTRVMAIQRYRVLAVCDWLLAGTDAVTLRTVLGRISRLSAAERPDIVMAQGGPPGPGARRALWRAGLAHVPDRFLPQPVAVFGGAPGVRGSTAGLPLLDRWMLTPGDWDVF